MMRTEEESVFAGIMAGFVLIATSGTSMCLGVVLSEKGNIERGRNSGIIYCTERPKQCATEYNYLKLKEKK
jgi:hypothetical protein